MIDTLPFRERTVAVLGLGRSGLAAAEALLASGAEVWAWDDAAAARATAATRRVPLVDLATCDWRKPAALVLSPGIPHTFPRPHPVTTLARAAGCAIVCDIDLLARAADDATFIGITGTNGKSTTTALLGHVLAATGRRIAVGGNLGPPALGLPRLGKDGIYVLEMSSYQLELVPNVTFDVAVLLNISPDHLDRHGGMDGYVAAKRRIFDRQGVACTAVVGIDDDRARAIFESLRARGIQRLIPISAIAAVAGGVSAVDGRLRDATGGAAVEVLDLGAVPTLPGAHNWQNAAAAYAAARAAGVAPERIAAAMRTYPGLPHRQERVAVIDGVFYVNDSKATNAQAAAKALASYRDIYWIAGGLPKEGGLADALPHLGGVRHAFLIGAAAEGFAAQLAGRLPFTRCGDLATALGAARRRALDDGAVGPVVLLSPACASFDQFKSFEERGEAFRKLVTDLPGRRTAGPIPPMGRAS